MITRDGVDWLTADDVREQFGEDITQNMLWVWAHRRLIEPKTVGAGRSRTAYYRRDEIERVELATRESRAGRPRPRRGA